MDQAWPSAEDILWDVEQQHLDEAEFLLDVRDAELDGPTLTLAELEAGPEQRLLSHVDALEVGGPVVAADMLVPCIEHEHADRERAAAATLAAWVHASDRVLAVLAAAASDDSERRDGIMQALALLDDPTLDERLLSTLESSRGAGRAAVLDVLARRGVRVGAWVANELGDEDPRVVRAAARLLRHCKEPRVLEHLAVLARVDDAELRRAALESALWRGMAGSPQLAAYWALVDGESPFRREAMVWTAMLGSAGEHERLLGLARQWPEDVLWALGFGGRVAAVDHCVGLLADAELGPLAGEVVCTIAGLSVADESMWTTPARSDDDELPALEEDLARELVPSPAEALPVPDAEAITRWWSAQRGRFDAGVRYLGGKPLDEAVMLDALWHAPLWRRHGFAFELGARTGGAAVVDARALAKVQRRQLAGVRGMEGVGSWW